MIVPQRELHWDFVKFILMFFIVFGHLCPAGEEWTPVTRIIGLFVIPGFFFVSGYFQSQVKDISGLSRKMKRLFIRIVLPMSSWGGIYVLLSLIQYVFSGEISNINDLFQFLKYFPVYIMGIYWFFTALILCVIFGSFFSFYVENNRFLGVSLLFMSPILFCITAPTFFEQYHFSFVWLFYVTGMMYRCTFCKMFSAQRVWDILLFVIFIVIIVIGVGYEPKHTFYYKSNLIFESSFSFVFFRYILYLAATIPVIYGLFRFYQIYKDNQKVVQMASYGADTLFIYCSHVLILVFLYRPFVLPCLYHASGGWKACVYEHIVGLIASVLMYLMMQKLCLYFKQFRLLRVFLMGEK